MKKEDFVILVVEDERPLSGAIKGILENNDFEVVTARSVDQALGYLEDIENIDAVWLDHYLLGEKSGLDFLAHLRDVESAKKVPVYVVTNTGGHDKKETYIKLGAEKYYVKVDSRLGEIVKDIKNQLLKKTNK